MKLKSCSKFAVVFTVFFHVSFSFVFVTINEIEYLALKVYLPSYESSGLQVYCISSTNIDTFEIKRDGITNEQEVSKYFAPYVDDAAFQQLKKMTVMNNRSGGSLGPVGPNKNKNDCNE